MSKFRILHIHGLQDVIDFATEELMKNEQWE